MPQGNQTANGSALEWALASCLAARLGAPVEDSRGKQAFANQEENTQQGMRQAADIAATHILEQEQEQRGNMPPGRVLMPPTAAGQHGDPRDIIITVSGKTFGISVKLNNNVMKNSRVQFAKPDFGASWGLSEGVSETYKNAIRGIAAYIKEAQDGEAENWSDLPALHNAVYAPVVNSFVAEFKRMAADTPVVCRQFVLYMAGSPDYYKVMACLNRREGNRLVMVQGFNFLGELSCSKPALPTKLLSAVVAQQSTAELSFDKGWVFTLRIHNARRKLENSLKWDVQMKANPTNLYVHNQRF